MTSQMLWPLATTNSGGQRPQKLLLSWIKTRQMATLPQYGVTCCTVRPYMLHVQRIRVTQQGYLIIFILLVILYLLHSIVVLYKWSGFKCIAKCWGALVASSQEEVPVVLPDHKYREREIYIEREIYRERDI